MPSGRSFNHRRPERYAKEKKEFQRFPSGDAPTTEVSQGRVIPLLAGARCSSKRSPENGRLQRTARRRGWAITLESIGWALSNCFRAPDAETEKGDVSSASRLMPNAGQTARGLS